MLDEVILKLLYDVNQVMKVFGNEYYYDVESKTFFTKFEGKFITMYSQKFIDGASNITDSLVINGKMFFDVFKEEKKPKLDTTNIRMYDSSDNLIKESGIEILQDFKYNAIVKSNTIEFPDESKVKTVIFKTVNGSDPIKQEVTFIDLIQNELDKRRQETGSPIIYMQFNIKDKDILLKRSKTDMDMSSIFLIDDRKTFRKYKSLKKDVPDTFMELQYNSDFNMIQLTYGNSHTMIGIAMKGVFKITNK